MTHTHELLSGSTSQDVNFPVWTTTAGCAITKYELDTDVIAPLVAPVGVMIKAGCSDPCNTLTVTTITESVVTFFIFVTSLGTANTDYSTQVSFNLICSPVQLQPTGILGPVIKSQLLTGTASETGDMNLLFSADINMNCIVTFSLLEQPAGTPYTGPDVSLSVFADNTFILTYQISLPMLKKLSFKAIAGSFGTPAYKDFDLVVCGLETISPTLTAEPLFPINVNTGISRPAVVSLWFLSSDPFCTLTYSLEDTAGLPLSSTINLSIDAVTQELVIDSIVPIYGQF